MCIGRGCGETALGRRECQDLTGRSMGTGCGQAGCCKKQGGTCVGFVFALLYRVPFGKVSQRRRN